MSLTLLERAELSTSDSGTQFLYGVELTSERIGFRERSPH